MLDEFKTTALELGKLLEEHKAANVIVLDMRELNFWTDFFVIATASSTTHLSGLERHIKDYAKDKGIEILRHSTRRGDTPDMGGYDADSPVLTRQDWNLIDMSGLVVHLMSEKARAFYELERLWSQATIIYPS
jgi:ribosome-associated protein